MRIDINSSLQQMQKLKNDEILKIKKDNGTTTLVVIKKGKLTFCQKVWKWLGCGSTSFNKVLKVIEQMQKNTPKDFQGKDFSVLKRKIDKHTPFFYKNIKAIVVKGLSLPNPPAAPVQKPIIPTQSPVDPAKPKGSQQPKPQPPPTQKELETPVTKLTDSQGGKKDSPISKTLAEINPLPETSSLDDFSKHIEDIENSNASPEEKSKEVASYLEKLYAVLKSDWKSETAQSLMTRHVELLKAWNTGEKTTPVTTFIMIASFLTDSDPKFSKKESHIVESLLVNSITTEESEKDQLSDAQLSLLAICKRNPTKDSEPRWKFLLQDVVTMRKGIREIRRNIYFTNYITQLRRDQDKDLIPSVCSTLKATLMNKFTGEKEEIEALVKLTELSIKSAVSVKEVLAIEFFDKFEELNNPFKSTVRSPIKDNCQKPELLWKALELGHPSLISDILELKFVLPKNLRHNFVKKAESLPGVTKEQLRDYQNMYSLR